jgi:lysophospholipase L1-like esterase
MTFSPGSLGGLLGQFEARSLALTDGASVASFTDLSGNARHIVQATGGLQPTFRATGGPNGTPTVQFASGNWMASASFSVVAQPLTLYLVANVTGTGSQHLFDAGVAGTNRCDVFLNTTAVELYAGGGGYVALLNQTLPFVPLVPTKASQLLRVVVNGASSTMFCNGVPSGLTGNPGANGLDGLTLGSYEGGAGGGLLTGTVSALLAYQGLHTSGQAAQVEGYLNSFLFNETRPQVVCDGDSLTFGYQLANPATQSYPAQLAVLLPAWDIYNTGVSGEPLGPQTGSAGMIGTAPNSVDPLFRAGRSANVCIAWGGVNDLLGISWAAGTAAALEPIIAAYCAARHAVGWKVVLVTLPPSNYSGTNAGYEAARLAYNLWLRANFAPIADGLLDLGGSTPYGQLADTVADTLDGLHLNAGGYTVLAGMAQPVATGFLPAVAKGLSNTKRWLPPRYRTR